MKQLKFRIWDKRENKFIYERDASYKRLAISLNGKVYHGGYDDVLSENDYVIQQYTGLKDKNGKDIYEGDIIKQWVCFGPAGEAQVESAVSITPFGTNIEGWSYNDGLLPEIIGNIFETTPQ